MADNRTLIIDADVARALAALRTVDQAVDKTGAHANKAAQSLNDVEGRTRRTADAQRRVADHTQDAAKGAGVLGRNTETIASGFGKAGAAVAALVASIMAADQAMQRVFSDRTVMANLPIAIDGAREATMGLVSDMELARQAISAQRLGLADTEAKFADLTEAAVKLGVSSGRTAEEGISAIVEGLGRGSTEMLDNVGVTIRAAEAQRLWALAHNTTVAAMTEEQKALAIKEIGMQKVIEAADKVTLTLTEQEQAWVNARKQWDELARDVLPRLTGESGGLWQALEAGAKKVEDLAPLLEHLIGAVGFALKPLVAIAGFFGDQLVKLGGFIEDAGVAFDHGKKAAAEYADEFGSWLSDSWAGEVTGDLVAMAEDGVERLSAALVEQFPFVADLRDGWADLRKQFIASGEGSLAGAIEDAANEFRGPYLDAAAKALQLAEKTKAIEAGKISALTSEAQAAEQLVRLGEAEGKSAAALEAAYRQQYETKLDLLLATDKIAEAEQLQLDEQVRRAKARNAGRGGGRGPTDADRIKSAGEIVIKQWEDQLALMEVEASILFEDTIAFEQVAHRLAVERLRLEQQTLEARRGGTSVEKQDREARIDGINREIEILERRFDFEQQMRSTSLEQGAAEERIAALDREIERNEALGVSVRLLQEQRNEAAIDYAIRFGDEEALREEQHAQEMARIEESAERWKAWDELRKKQAENETKRLDAQKKNQQKTISAISGFLGQGQQFAEIVTNAAIKNDAKREKAAMKMNGVMALARAALETVEAVAAFARYDFVAGAAHTAAAVLGSVTGFALISGVLPQGGAAGASAGSVASSGGGAQAQTFGGGSQEQRELPSTPASAEALTRARGGLSDSSTTTGSGGGNVTQINAGVIVTSDSGYQLGNVANDDRRKYG